MCELSTSSSLFNVSRFICRLQRSLAKLKQERGEAESDNACASLSLDSGDKIAPIAGDKESALVPSTQATREDVNMTGEKTHGNAVEVGEELARMLRETSV